MRATARRLAAAAAAMLGCAAAPHAARASAYDDAVLADQPALFWAMDSGQTGQEPDLSGHGLSGSYVGGAPGQAALPNGDTAAVFDGASQYLTAASAKALSVPAAKALTIESWIRPDTVQFPHADPEGFVYWLGKGTPRDGYEYANRIYSLDNPAGRPSRISVY